MEESDPRLVGIQAVVVWLQTKSRYTTVDLEHLEVDIAHSALLHRILDGLPVLPVPPPRAHSYPWYELLEKGEGTPHEVFEEKTFFPFHTLIIDQSPWKIVEKVRDEEWRVRYMIGRDGATWSDTVWRVFRGANERWVVQLAEGQP